MMVEPHAVALVALLPTEQGGRAGPTPAEWFGCVLTIAERNVDARLRLDRPLAPGMTRRVEVMFLDEALAGQLSPGTSFSVWEGREIGFGRIERVRGAAPIAA